jgi:hypothetical protein
MERNEKQNLFLYTRWGCEIAYTGCHALDEKEGNVMRQIRIVKMLLVVPLFDKQDNYSFQSVATHRHKFDGKHDDMT